MAVEEDMVPLTEAVKAIEFYHALYRAAMIANGIPNEKVNAIFDNVNDMAGAL